MGGDQFSRTMGPNYVGRIEQVDRSTIVNQITPLVGKKVELRNEDSRESQSGVSHLPDYSTLIQPEPELWNTVTMAAERFNEHLDDRNMDFSVRIWAQNSGFRLQLIHDTRGALIKQTQIIPFASVTKDDLDNIINSLLQEQGVVIDLLG